MRNIAERVRDLEQRVAVLERDAAPAPEPRPVAPPPVERPITVERVRPRPAPVPAASAPPGAPPRPRSLEVDFGRWMSRLGGAALVVAAGFLFAYAAKRGWLNPSLRVVAGLVAGCALVAAGEWQQRKLKHFSAALTGAGIGILYVSVYAGYAFLDFFSPGAALALSTFITAGAVAQALRHDVEAVAGLAAVGGFLAPAIVLDLHAQPLAVLEYVLVLNGGFCLLRARRGWLSPEVFAWLGTPLVVALPMTRVNLGFALGFLLANVLLFGVRPRLRGGRADAMYTLGLTALAALASYLLFSSHGTPGWALFAAGLSAVLAVAAYLHAPRSEDIAVADLLGAAGLAVLAILDGLEGWRETVAWSALAVGLQLLPMPRLRRPARLVGGVVALLTVVHLAAHESRVVDHQLLAFLAAAAAVAAIRSRAAEWGAIALVALGFAAQVAAARGANPWATLLFLTEESALPTTRLLVSGIAAGIVLAFAIYRREANVVRGAGAYLGLLVVAETLFLVERNGVMAIGLVCAAALILLPANLRSIVAVAVALSLAIAADLIPPEGYLPFLNRRAFAIGAVLGIGAWTLRGRPESRACVLMLLLLGSMELASTVDRAGGATPWRHLFLDPRTSAAVLPFLNARFLFLAGAAATAFVAARRWPVFALFGHGYALLALGAEVVGLVRPDLRSTIWPIFVRPGQYMGPQLALTGVILCYGAALVTVGILEKAALSRRIGMAMLLCGGLKVSALDLIALGDLYRVGSFLVLGATYLAGSYAYNRWVIPEGDAKPPG